MTTVDLNQLAASKLLRKDLPLDEATVDLEVDVATHGFITPRGEVLDVGVHRITVYVSELPRVERLVEDATEEDMRRVVAEHDYALEQAKDPNGQPRPYLPSIPAAFREVMKRDMRPLRRCTRVGGDKSSKRAA